MEWLIVDPSHPHYPLRERHMLYHASWKERRRLRRGAFLASHASIAKRFASKPQGGTAIRMGQGATPGGYVSRYILQRLPRLLFLNNHLIVALTRSLAKTGALDLHPMPRGRGPRMGAWLSEVASAFVFTRPSDLDGWFFPYEAHADPPTSIQAEYMLVNPMQFLQFWGSAEVTPLDFARARGPSSLRGLDDTEEASVDLMEQAFDVFVEADP